MSFGRPFFLSHWPNGLLWHCSLPKWIIVEEFGAKALLGSPGWGWGWSLPKAAHFHLRGPGRGKPHTSTWNWGKKPHPIPDTKPHKCFMQSSSPCICSLVSQPECLINRFLFCPPRSSEQHWRVGSELAHPGCLKGSSSWHVSPKSIAFLLPHRCPTHRAVGLKIFGN